MSATYCRPGAASPPSPQSLSISKRRTEPMKQPSWPRLPELRSRDHELDLRRRFIGGSDANVIFSGNSEKVRDLWLEKRGDKQPSDLSDILPVVLGSWTE